MLLLLPGSERKKRIVEELLGHPVPGGVLDSVMQLVMAASQSSLLLARRFRDMRLIPLSTLEGRVTHVAV